MYFFSIYIFDDSIIISYNLFVLLLYSRKPSAQQSLLSYGLAMNSGKHYKFWNIIKASLTPEIIHKNLFLMNNDL